jgi:hypothetical protein
VSPDLDALHERRERLGIPRAALMRAARVYNYSVKGLFPAEMERLEMALYLVEIGTALEDVRALIRPSKPQQNKRPQVPHWPAPARDPEHGLEGNCFAAGPDGDPDPGDGGLARRGGLSDKIALRLASNFATWRHGRELWQK